MFTIVIMKQNGCNHHIIPLLAALVVAICANPPAHADGNGETYSYGSSMTSCTECNFKFSVKTNLLHDALLTPDFGIELSLARRWSLSAQGIYAWWSRPADNFYWRIRGSSLEFRYWFGRISNSRALTGHHIGIYGSIHDYDFEFGNTGYQAPDMTFGIGLSYGYSLKLNNRLNLDFSLRAGYSAGNQIKYHPECGTYVCDSHRYFKYFGPTALEITLVWFPGRNNFNNPEFPAY